MNPILIDVPMPILTPRLLIKPRQIGEGVVIAKAVANLCRNLLRARISRCLSIVVMGKRLSVRQVFIDPIGVSRRFISGIGSIKTLKAKDLFSNQQTH